VSTDLLAHEITDAHTDSPRTECLKRRHKVEEHGYQDSRLETSCEETMRNNEW